VKLYLCSPISLHGVDRQNNLFHLYLSGNGIMAKVKPSLILGNDHVEKFLTSLDRTPCSRVDRTGVYFLKTDTEDTPGTYKRTYHKGRRHSPQAFKQWQFHAFLTCVRYRKQKVTFTFRPLYFLGKEHPTPISMDCSRATCRNSLTFKFRFCLTDLRTASSSNFSLKTDHPD
jgi:hypothetical protein